MAHLNSHMKLASFIVLSMILHYIGFESNHTAIFFQDISAAIASVGISYHAVQYMSHTSLLFLSLNSLHIIVWY